jgi:hypothetical protein
MPSGKTCLDTPPDIPADCCTSAKNFIELLETDGDKIGPYDTTSIMHYRADEFASTGLMTLTAFDPASGIVVPTTKTGFPSLLDFFGMCSLYGSRCPGADECRRMGCFWRRTECGGLLNGEVVSTVCDDHGLGNSPATKCGGGGHHGSIDIGCIEPSPEDCEIHGCS